MRKWIGAPEGAPVIYKPQTKYVLMSSEVFRISGVAASVWCCYCNLEMALRHMSLGMDQWQPQHSRSSHGFSQGTRVGRQICQSVASGVCFLQPRLLKCMLSLTFFFGVHTQQPQS